MTAANWQNNFRFARQPSGTCGAAEQSVNTSRLLATNSEFAFCEHVLGAPIASLTDSIRNGSPMGHVDFFQNQTLAPLARIPPVAFPPFVESPPFPSSH